MDRTALREMLLQTAARQIVESGIEALSLRTVTAAVGKSTTAIVHGFGDKAGFIEAVVARARARDHAFHEAMRSTLAGIPLTPPILADLVVNYVLSRAVEPDARIFLEALYKARQFPGTSAILTQWNAERAQFWRCLLEESRFEHLAAILPDYLAGEEAYAAALAGEAEYRLLLHASARDVAGVSSGEEDAGAPLGSWIEGRAAFQSIDSKPLPAAMEQALFAAVRSIEREGASGLNIKRLAEEEGVAHSQIIYHFGSFAAFRNQAIWRALMQGLPETIDSKRPHPAAFPDGRSLDALDAMVTPGSGGANPGYYVGYGRILGQACLAAQVDTGLKPLILHLRAIEGRGIFRASVHDWPNSHRLSRSRATPFAIWIKGHAILNETLERHSVTPDRAGSIGWVAELLARPPTRESFDDQN